MEIARAALLRTRPASSGSDERFKRRGSTPPPDKEAPEMLRTVIVDDDRGMRLVARLLAEEEGCAVVGEAETGEQAVRLAMRMGPDAVLMDFRLPGMDGVEATRL